MLKKLKASDLYHHYDPKLLNCKSSADIGSQGVIIGQERAVHALQFGLGIRDRGFNIFVAGIPGTGRTTAVEHFLQEIAVAEVASVDWCYVHNFEDSYRPHAIALPAGTAREYQKDIDGLIKSVSQAIKEAFEGEQYSKQREATIRDFQMQKEQLIEKLGVFAKQNNFGLQATPMGIMTVPLKDGKPFEENDFENLSDEERKKISLIEDKVQETIEATLRQTRLLDNNAGDAINKLDQQVIHFVLDHLMSALVEKYSTLPEVQNHLKAIENYIIENIPLYKSEPSEDEKQIPGAGRSPTDKFRVNVLVDNGKIKGAPVVVELNPTYNNLFGRIEHEAMMGALVTDFTLVRGGSLHRANGGYLVLPAEDVVRNPFTWESLKRSLHNRQIAIEEPLETPVFMTKSLRPKPIPLDVKVILIGRPETYELLLAYDEHFQELFKVKADFDTQMEWTDDHIQEYAGFVCGLCETENIKHLDPTGLARVIEHSARMAENQSKLSTHFGEIADVIREANYYATQEKARLVRAKHIEKAVEERFYRSGLIQDRLLEMTNKGVINIQITGSAVGQVNGLSVISLGDISFGHPSRITASVGVGEHGVVNVEREAQMSGPTHTKGVLILAGYLAQQFAQNKPLSLNAHLVFEQNYGGVDGDSASSTELYAILSALSGVPIKQGIAVTGSVNQKGQVQAIGGVNEKIEGYFEVCKGKGLNGDQGVMIPASNTANLMLKHEVVEAVQNGKFSIWTVDTIEDGIEVLTGVPAGKNGDGTFAPDGVYAKVDSRLTQMAEEMARFGFKK